MQQQQQKIGSVVFVPLNSFIIQVIFIAAMLNVANIYENRGCAIVKMLWLAFLCF